MATQVSASQSTAAGAPKGDSAMDLLESAFDDLGEESSAGADTVNAEDSLDEDADQFDIDAVDEEAEAEAGEGDAVEDEIEDIADGDDGKKSEKLEIEVTDETGKRVIEFDPSDTKAITRAVQQAAGARKLYKQYQSRGVELEEARAATAAEKGVADSMRKLESIYEQKGIDGVLELLEGKNLAKLVEERAAFQAWYAKATPQEKAAYDAKMAREAADKQIAAANRERDDARAAAQAEKDAAAIRALETTAHTAFHKHSFAGQLGDKAAEIRMDRILWNNMQAELDQLERQKVELTPAVVRKVAADTAAALGVTVKKASDKRVKQTMDKKKENATRAAQTRMVKSDAKVDRSIGLGAVDVGNTQDVAQLMAAALGGGRKRRK